MNAVQCSKLDCHHGSHPDLEADYADVPRPFSAEDIRRYRSDPRNRLHRCLVIALRQPYGNGGTNQGVEIEGVFMTGSGWCTCPDCGQEHPAKSRLRTVRKVVHPVQIECRWDQAGVWMASHLVLWDADDELKWMTGE